MSPTNNEELERLNRLIDNLEKKRSEGTIDEAVYTKLHSEYSARIHEPTGGSAPSPVFRGVEGSPIAAAAAQESPRILEVQSHRPSPTSQIPQQGETAAKIAIAIAVLLAVLLILFVGLR